jgi:hypothetical protein
MRKTFLLPEADQLYLNALALPWETIVDRGGQWLIIHKFPVPIGYNCPEVSIALMVPPGYPVAQFDMAYFSPALSRIDGRPIGALTAQMIEGTNYQRWSRHRTGENPWRPGIDDVSTHLSMVNTWFEKELKK